MTNHSSPVCILGGAGKTGGRLAQRLAARGIPTRLASRSGAVRFDWTDRATWAPALAGAGAVYLAYQPDIAIPGALDDVRELAQLAIRTGARRIVMLSGRGEPVAQRAEDAVRASDAALTVVRAAFFSQNFSEGILLDAVRRGVIAFPAGDVGEPFVDADDIADVAAAAFLDRAHVGQTYDLTGPRLLTFAAVADALSRATGRAIRYEPITAAAYGEALAPHVPPGVGAFIAELLAEVLDGHNAHVTDGVQRALGRPARDFADYARTAAATGVWS